MPNSGDTMKEFSLLYRCKDRTGVVADVSRIISFDGVSSGYNISYIKGVPFLDQFVVRATFEDKGHGWGDEEEVRRRFDSVMLSDRLEAWSQIRDISKKLKVGVLVSKQTHCLKHLLNAYEEGDLHVDIPLVISNHANGVEDIVRRYDVDFKHIPVDKDGKRAAEDEILSSFGDVDVIVMARYMQILSAYFLEEFNRPVINVHHGDVKAFPGARPYHQAFDAGVKELHPTAHYAIPELDAGPIIWNESVRVNDTDRVEDFVRKGKNAESQALVKALELHSQDRIITYANKTMRFLQ